MFQSAAGRRHPVAAMPEDAAFNGAKICGVAMMRIFLWILGGVAVLAAAAAVVLSRVDADFVVREIADATASATGQPLRFDTPPGISFFPPGVHFGQAHWGDITDGQGMAVSVKGGMAQLELRPLFTGNVVVREVRLDSPVIEIRQGKAVASPERTKKKSTGTASAPAEKEAPALPLELKRLVLRQGAVTYVEASGRSLRVSDMNLSIENLRRNEEAVVQCDFAFALSDREGQAPADAFSGTLAFTSRLRYAPPQLAFRQTALTVTPLTGPLPREAGPLQLTCEGSLQLNDLRLRLNKAWLTAPQARLGLTGEGVLAAPSFDGALELEGSPRKLAALAGHRFDAAGGKDEALFKSRVRYAANSLRLNEIQARMDDISLRGDLRLDMPPAAPMALTADLRSGMVNLDPYLPSAASKTDAKARAEDSASGTPKTDNAQSGRSGGMSPEKARTMPTLDIRATLAGVSRGGLAAKDVSLALKGEKGRYALTAFHAVLATGGDIKASGVMDMGTTTCAVKTTASGVNLGPLLDALGKGRPVDGVAALDADLTMRCADAAVVRQSLSGRGLVEIRNLYVPAMAGLSKSIPALTGKKGALPDRFDLARAPFTAHDGEITAAPVTLTSSGLNATGKAHVSLPGQRLDAAMDIRTMGLTIPVTAKGPLDDISYGVDPRFALDMAKNLPGALLDTGKQAGSATEDAAKGAGGLLQQGAKGAGGLLRGILGR